MKNVVTAFAIVALASIAQVAAAQGSSSVSVPGANATDAIPEDCHSPQSVALARRAIMFPGEWKNVVITASGQQSYPVHSDAHGTYTGCEYRIAFKSHNAVSGLSSLFAHHYKRDLVVVYYFDPSSRQVVYTQWVVGGMTSDRVSPFQSAYADWYRAQQEREKKIAKDVAKAKSYADCQSPQRLADARIGIANLYGISEQYADRVEITPYIAAGPVKMTAKEMDSGAFCYYDARVGILKPTAFQVVLVGDQVDVSLAPEQ